MYMSTMYMSIYLKGPSSAKFFFLPPKKSFDWKAQNPLWIPVVNAIKRGVPSQLLGIIILFWWWQLKYLFDFHPKNLGENDPK